MILENKITRFRAYQLGNEGSSFSYFDGRNFTLIEARLNEVNEPSLKAELNKCGKVYIDTLHITSWDDDHCKASELEIILQKYKPSKIEYPGYKHNTQNYKNSLDIIQKYKTTEVMSIIEQMLLGSPTNTITETNNKRKIIVQKIDPEYIKTLEKGSSLAYKDIFYNPIVIWDTSNDNSTVKLFRTGCFNVASLGDVEDSRISSYLRSCSIFNKEVDVMILAHHGADNGFTTHKFLKMVKPTVAICSSNYDNRFDHPRQEIRDMLYEHNISLFTTKTGDVIIESYGKHTHLYQVTNLITDSTTVSSVKEFSSKKHKLLKLNQDSMINHYNQKSPFYTQFTRK